MPKKASTTWSGGSIRLDTADKKELIAHPQQQHNLSLAPSRNVLLTAPPNKGKSSLRFLCVHPLTRLASSCSSFCGATALPCEVVLL